MNELIIHLRKEQNSWNTNKNSKFYKQSSAHWAVVTLAQSHTKQVFHDTRLQATQFYENSFDLLEFLSKNIICIKNMLQGSRKSISAAASKQNDSLSIRMAWGTNQTNKKGDKNVLLFIVVQILLRIIYNSATIESVDFLWDLFFYFDCKKWVQFNPTERYKKEKKQIIFRWCSIRYSIASIEKWKYHCKINNLWYCLKVMEESTVNSATSMTSTVVVVCKNHRTFDHR